MIFAHDAISMALTSRPCFPLPFDKEEALTGTAVTVEDEGVRADKGRVNTSSGGGVEGSLVSSDKYIIITIYLPSLIDFFQSLISVIRVTQTSRRKLRPMKTFCVFVCVCPAIMLLMTHFLLASLLVTKNQVNISRLSMPLTSTGLISNQCSCLFNSLYEHDHLMLHGRPETALVSAWGRHSLYCENNPIKTQCSVSTSIKVWEYAGDESIVCGTIEDRFDDEEVIKVDVDCKKKNRKEAFVGGALISDPKNVLEGKSLESRVYIWVLEASTCSQHLTHPTPTSRH